MKKLLSLAAVALLAAPLAASADGSIAISGRGGAAKPFGDVSGGNGGSLGDAIDWAFPLQADLQFRFTKSFSVGAYGKYAPTVVAAKTSDACKLASTSCSYAQIGFGGLVEYRFSERLEGGPWIGLSAGYELLKGDTTAAGKKSTDTISGYEGGLQVGTDFELGGLTIGPFVQVGAGQFTTVKREGEGTSTTQTISDKSVHGWAGVGLRFTLLL